MKINKIILAISAMTTSFAPYADVGLHFGHELSPIVVQGEEMGFFSSPDNFMLENGNNQIVFRMEKLIQSNGGEKAKFNSHAFVMSFNAANVELLLESDMRVLRESESVEFNRNPRVKLLDKNGRRVDFTIDVLPAGNSLTRNYIKELAHYNKVKGLEFIPAAATSAVQSTVTTPIAKSASSDDEQVSPSSMIEYWVDKASAQETEQFVDWAFDNRSVTQLEPLAASQTLNMLSYWYGEANIAERKQILAWLINQ